MIEEGSLFPNAIVGYRAWVVTSAAPPNLAAIYTGQRWDPGANEATCNRWVIERKMLSEDRYPAHYEQCPARNCMCGFYSLHKPHSSVGIGYVFGAVVNWGKLAVHSNGLRAQYSMLVCLLHDGQIPGEVMTELAWRYHVPVATSREGLELEALKHGQRLPRDAVPEPIDKVIARELRMKRRAMQQATVQQQRRQFYQQYYTTGTSNTSTVRYRYRWGI